MASDQSCPDCGAEIESTDDVETDGEVAEVATDGDGSVTLFENRDLFLCENCKSPLGFSAE